MTITLNYLLKNKSYFHSEIRVDVSLNIEFTRVRINKVQVNKIVNLI